jgi:competence protein ComFC
MEIHPKKIVGAWDEGYVLDVHTISSTMIGYNEFGYPEFDTVRSPLGEIVYRLKYKADKAAVTEIVEVMAEFIRSWGIRPDVVVAMPPSKVRVFQPVSEITGGLAVALGIPTDSRSLTKTKTTSQMKDIGDFSARVAALESAFAVTKDLQDRAVLLVDDLFQSGASMNVVATTLKREGLVKAVYVLAATRTRS